MKFTPIKLLACSVLLLSACSDAPDVEEAQEVQSEEAAEVISPTNIVEIRAVGMTFEGPSEIPSGWTTFRFVNASEMIHFALIDAPPEGVTAEIMSSSNIPTFQAAMDAMNANDEDAVNTAFGQFPAWMGDMKYMGGPGFLSPGLTGETTVYLEPGNYVIECYVKTGGIFHTLRPSPDTLGMLLELTVTDEANNAREPAANVTITISNSGLAITDGSLRSGANILRVDFSEQQTFPTFVGNDVHIVRLDSDDALNAAADWLDWRKPEGLETPSPATFIGGINDMPSGAHGYIHVDLSPGAYALIGETPSPEEDGFILPFEIE